MPTDASFQKAYEAIEQRMEAQAAAEGAVFLPNVVPEGPVECVLICMEPSLGRWAATAEDKRARVLAGFRNFLSTVEDFILHFCASEYLCRENERYHITDLSKGAMLVKTATIARFERYDRWYALFLEELDLILRPGAVVVAVGNAVAQHLERRAFPRPFERVIHYSGQAAAARKAGIVGRRQAFDDFAPSVSMADLVRIAESLLTKVAIPTGIRMEILSRLAKANLSESRRELLFNYKTVFTSIRYTRDLRAPAV